MKKVIAEIGAGSQFVIEITEDSYRRQEFYIPLAKNLSISEENMIASPETTTKKLVFRKYGDVFRLVGWED